MKNDDFYKSMHIKNVCFIFVIVLISYFITACAGNQTSNHTTISAEEIEQHRDNQQKWLSGLQEGMSMEDSLRQVLSYQQYFFQYKENGILFQYMQGQNPITGMVFGLFFEDGRLTSLLLDQAVNDFYFCRYNLYVLHGDNWLPSGFQAASTWIKLQSRLGDKYNDVSTSYQQNQQNANDSGIMEKVGDGVEIATYLPMIAVFLPFYLGAQPFLQEDKIIENPNKITENPNETAEGPDEKLLNSYGHPEQLREIANQIELGVTTDIEMMRLWGAPDYKTDTMWVYSPPTFKFGIVGNTVRWSESWSWYDKGVPRNNTTTNQGSSRCEPSN
jgi:hypothetical protein